MRLTDYLIEDKTITLPSNPDESESHIRAYLERDCKPFLKAVGKYPLYRGMPVNEDMMDLIPRKNRTPRDMKRDYHQTLDILFKKKFGWKPRSSGIFCTGSQHTASQYGRIYSVWPKGQFKFIWSPKITDLYMHIKRLEEKFVATASTLENLSGDDIIKHTLTKLQKLVDTYQNNALHLAIDNEHEIAISCKSYYMIHNSNDYAIKRILLDYR